MMKVGLRCGELLGEGIRVPTTRPPAHADEAAQAIRQAGELLAGRDAIVLSVAVPAKDEMPLDPMSDLVGRLSGLYSDWDEACAALAAGQARHGCQLASHAGMRATPLTAVGKIAPTILRIADEHDVGLIVLGAGSPGALGGLLGSVAARVVHQAKRPVLVVPAPGAHGYDVDSPQSADG